ncbi:hypothetical protein KJ885_01170 [Patescibacteria group bacterium]|nr:hypothetical protein [Patescibacteria group bacterium]
MAKKMKKKLSKLYNLLMVIKQNKLLFTIYSVAVFIILIIMDYWAGFFKLSLVLTPFIDSNTQYLHFLPFINLNLNPVVINFNGYVSISNLTWGGFVIYCLSMILTSLIIGLLLTWLTIKLEKIFNSKKKPFILVFIPFFALSLSAAGLSANIKSHNISWVPEKITQTVFTGTTKILNAQFVANEDLENVKLELVPELAKFISVQPSEISNITAGQKQLVSLLFSVPRDTELGTYEGTLHLKLDKKTIPQTLKIILNIKEPTAEDIPTDISLPSSERIYTDPATGNEFVKDEILVAFKKEVNETIIKNIVSEIGGVFMGGNKQLNLYQIKVSITNVDELNTLIQALEANPEVIFASHSWLEKLQ